MGNAKQIRVEPIAARDANRIIKSLHYSSKVVPNSQLHFGIFLNGRCGGAMQFGPSLNGRSMRNLVAGTGLREYIELNRMAFADWLPRNSESRAIGITLRILRKQYKHLKWVVSFADGCHCGDGTIYRASGFLLTDIRKNDALRRNPETGEVRHTIWAHHNKLQTEFRRDWIPLVGYQLRYVYFLHPSERDNLTVDALPFSAIADKGATMYRGERPT